MYRLGELTQEQRNRYGWALMLVGLVGLVVGVFFVHYTQAEPGAGMEWVPRGWVFKGIAYLVAFGASQLMVVGSLLAFVLGRQMTWVVATFAAFVAWVEMVILFGIVPSEWLNLSQTDLDWSIQRVAFTVPPWLILGNQVDISWGAIKDMISMGYNLTVLVAAAVFAYKLQDIKKGRPASAEKPAPVSPYGRPLVRGDS